MKHGTVTSRWYTLSESVSSLIIEKDLVVTWSSSRLFWDVNGLLKDLILLESLNVVGFCYRRAYFDDSIIGKEVKTNETYFYIENDRLLEQSKKEFNNINCTI